MKSYIYYCIQIFLITLIISPTKSFSEAQSVIITIPDAEKPDEKEEAPPEAEPIKLPEDIRTQLNINLLNESGKTVLIYTKIRAATSQEGSTIQPWEYLKVFTAVKESATLATFHGGPGAKYEYERSRLYLHEKDADGEDSFETIECKLAPSVAGKVASKSITFFVGKEPGEDVISCLVYYDKG
jgi:hypothetical protein